MKQILTHVIMTLCLASAAYGQGQIIMTQSGTGQLFRQVRGEGFLGSPFLMDDALPGLVTTSFGATYRMPSLIFDVYNNRLLSATGDSLFHLTDGVVAFTLEAPTSMRTFQRLPSTIPALDNRLVEILADGKLKYVIDHHRRLEEAAVYGGASEKEMRSFTDTYIVIGTQWKLVSPSVSLLRSLTEDRAAEMQAFLASARFNFKKDAGFAAGINYYNSLFTKAAVQE